MEAEHNELAASVLRVGRLLDQAVPFQLLDYEAHALMFHTSTLSELGGCQRPHAIEKIQRFRTRSRRGVGLGANDTHEIPDGPPEPLSQHHEIVWR